MTGKGWKAVEKMAKGGGWRVARALRRVVLGLLIGLLLLPAGPADALSLPGWGKGRQQKAGLGGEGSSAVQEVSPPGAVRQLREALADRRPRLAIEAPADEALLPTGPWTLRLALEDWPLVDAGPLGLGPHLRVQLDDAPPLAVTSTEVAMPPLTPGSHRVTVYAAWPWGEAVKSPGAWRQVHLHRTAANPLSLPPRGSAQLLAVNPSGAAAAEPLLLDWLLIDAPLQNLREEDARWKLRITLNGDSFLVDRQQALWLKGWRRGSNALLLELVNPRGEPLNPPFNSLVRELNLTPGSPSPVWMAARLDEGELATLLGEARAEPEPEPDQEAEPALEPEPEQPGEAGGQPALPFTPSAPLEADSPESPPSPDDRTEEAPATAGPEGPHAPEQEKEKEKEKLAEAEARAQSEAEARPQPEPLAGVQPQRPPEADEAAAAAAGGSEPESSPAVDPPNLREPRDGPAPTGAERP